MILKKADGREDDVTELERLLEIASGPMKERISSELRNIKAGMNGENQSAYLLDFHLKDSKNTVVIHDLRVELPNGNTAQIDHLLINKTFKFFVLETKKFHAGCKINDDGTFMRWNNFTKQYEGMPSPIEQNFRHAEVLKGVLKSLGLPDPNIKCFVLVPGGARIIRSKKFDCSQVVDSDQFIKTFENELLNDGWISALSGLLSTGVSGGVEKVGNDLINLHKPIKINYVAKFNVKDEDGSSKRPEKKVEAKMTDSAQLATCKKCGGHNMAIADGKTGHYFKCEDCKGNSAICKDASHRVKAERSAGKIECECATCGTSWTLNEQDKKADEIKKMEVKASSFEGPAGKVDHSKTCSKCNGSDVHMEWGKFGYYLKCHTCQGNTAVKPECSVAGHKARIRKSGETYFSDCDICKTSTLFFENGHKLKAC